MTWIITANSNSCRIYSLEEHPAKITFIKEINHPETKLKQGEYLTSDKPGRYQTDGSGGGAYSPHSDPKEVEINNFSREIVNELNRGRNSNEYKQLIVITPPHMKGLLFKHMDKHVKELVASEIQKDVMPLTEQELFHFLQKNYLNK